jgi:iron complex transport system permease protein
MTIRRRLFVSVAAFGSLALAAIVLAPFLGTTPIRLSRVFSRAIPFAENPDAQIFFVARLPRALAGALVGAALAASGVVLQALLGNPLASPFTLGVSAGAALGAMLAITLPLQLALAGVSPVPIASFAGSVGAAAIDAPPRRAGGASPPTCCCRASRPTPLFSALIPSVRHLADFTQTLRTVRWLMGDLDVAGISHPHGAPFAAVAFAMFAWLPRALNLLTLGADAAAARGVDVVQAQRLAFFSSSLATGAAVSLAGPIGFVGIVVPHLVRLIVGSDHRVVLPASALFGAAFLVACDVAARSVLAPMELPVGILTAMCGPFFLWLLIRKQ